MAMVPAEQLLTAKERNLLANLWTEPHLATKLALAGLIAFLFCPLEGSLSLWGRTFLADLYPQPRTVHWIMAGYWLAYLVSRLAMAMIPHNGYEMWIILALALVAAVTFGNLRGAYNPASGALAFILIGGLIGPIFPTLLAVGLTLSSPGLQAQATEQASAVAGLFALGTLGNLLFQPPLRAFAKSHAVRLSLRVPMILALILGIPLLILALIRFQM
jgi:fucose permease